MKKIFSASIFLFAFLVSGCKKKSAEILAEKNSVPDEKKITIGFAIDSMAIERWQRDLDVFMSRTKELGGEVVVQNSGSNVDEQKRQLMYLLERNVDAIVILPKEAKSLTEEIEKIRGKNIPVIAYDRLILGTKIDLYVTVDSEKSGRLMGETMQKICSRNWLFILGPQEDYNMELILQGIFSSMKNPQSSVQEIFYTQGWNYDLARRKMIRVVKKGQLPGAVICGNDAIADSVISVLKTYYPEKKIAVCGQDAEISACQNIVSGYQSFTIFKPIVELAKVAAECSVRLARGEKVESLENLRYVEAEGEKIPSMLLEPKVVTQENLEDVIIKSGFHTYSEIFKN